MNELEAIAIGYAIGTFLILVVAVICILWEDR